MELRNQKNLHMLFSCRILCVLHKTSAADASSWFVQIFLMVLHVCNQNHITFYLIAIVKRHISVVLLSLNQCRSIALFLILWCRNTYMFFIYLLVMKIWIDDLKYEAYHKNSRQISVLKNKNI